MSNKAMIIELTPEQIEQLQPLICRVYAAHDAHKPVMLLGQIAYSAYRISEMSVGIIPHNQAMEICKVVGIDPEEAMKNIYKNETKEL